MQIGILGMKDRKEKEQKQMKTKSNLISFFLGAEMNWFPKF